MASEKSCNGLIPDFGYFSLGVVANHTQLGKLGIKACEKIKESSPVNEEKMKETIFLMIRQLPDHPKKYPLDRFKKDNPGNYRAFEKYAYRVAYRHTDSEIKILRVRHVKQEPKSY